VIPSPEMIRKINTHYIDSRYTFCESCGAFALRRMFVAKSRRALKTVRPERPGLPKTAEHDALRQARHLLDEAIASPSGDIDTSCRGLTTSLRRLGRVFAEHVRESEASDGSLREILQLKPHLLSSVAVIKEEHNSIEAQRAMIERIVCDADAKNGKDVTFLREHAGSLLESVRLHQAKGVDLLYEAFYRVEGGPG